MSLTALDWCLVVGYVLASLGVGLAFRRRAGASLDEFLVSGRRLPWWLAGTSMVATSFAADTPLAVTGLVATQGIAGNWFWWSLAVGHVLATFLFARLWRRAGVRTDLELVELRYSGRPARFLRAFRSVWEGLVLNCLIMGWVTLAMVKILGAVVDLDAVAAALRLGGLIDSRWIAIALCLLVAATYTAVSGLWGVVVTDALQFVVAMAGSVALAIVALRRVGGVEGLRAHLATLDGGADGQFLRFVPEAGSELLPPVTFLAFLTVNWWAGRQGDAGAILAQRMLASRDERHSFLAALWFTVAHYVLRPWPWILVGLASLVVFPDLADREMGYPLMVREHLPPGLLGLMLASFVAAFMSTLDSQLHWGASLLVNDLYRPYLRPAADERSGLRALRLAVVLQMALAGAVAYYTPSIVGAWETLIGMTAGIGGVYILRWLWWRVSAWSEIAAWISAAAVFVALRLLAPDLAFGWRLLVTTALTTGCWLAVTFVTPPTDARKLLAFYERVRPGAAGWGPVAARSSVPAERTGWRVLGHWAAGVALVYSALFGIGKLLLEGWEGAWPYLAVSVASGWVVAAAVRTIARSTPYLQDPGS